MKKSDAFVPIIALQLSVWLGGCSSSTEPNALPQANAGLTGAPVPVPRAAPSVTAGATKVETTDAAADATAYATTGKNSTQTAPTQSNSTATAHDALSAKSQTSAPPETTPAEKAPVKAANLAEIPELLEKAHSLYKSQKREAADAIVESILTADPTNVAALRLRSRMTVLLEPQKALEI